MSQKLVPRAGWRLWLAPMQLTVFCQLFTALGSLMLANQPRHCAAAASRTEHRLQTFVTYVGTNPLRVCWGSYAPPHKSPVSAKEDGLGSSRLVFWRDGVVWSRDHVRGGAWLRYLPKRSLLAWCTPRTLHVVSMRPHGQHFRIPVRAGFLFAYYTLAIREEGGDIASVAAERFNAPYFHPMASFEVKLVDLRNGRDATAPVDGFPLGLGFDGDKLIVGTCAFPSSLGSPMKKHFFLDTFSVTKVHRKLALKRVSHERCAGPLQSFAGGKPVLVTVGGSRVFVGGVNVDVGKKGGKIKQVVGEPGAVLVVKSDGSYGVAQKPHWGFRRLGSLSAGDVIGAGHNSAGFWLAQAGSRLGVVRITEISAGGAAQTRTIKIFGHTLGKTPPAGGGK